MTPNTYHCNRDGSQKKNNIGIAGTKTNDDNGNSHQYTESNQKNAEEN
jgi:hypothetical protein